MTTGWVARRARLTGDEGSSIIEFLGLALILVVPLVYLVLALARLEAATFAAEGAAREAARTYVAADDADVGVARAVAAVGIALRDQGFDDDPPEALVLTCGHLFRASSGKGRIDGKARQVDVQTKSIGESEHVRQHR